MLHEREHGMFDDDPMFIINEDTRDIVYQGEEPPAIMQYDHLAEIMTFEMPRYIADGHDTMLCNVMQVHFINIGADGRNSSSGCSDVYNLYTPEDNENVVRFCWNIPFEATKFEGKLHFIIAFKCVDLESGIIKYRWSTERNDSLVVSAGIDNTSNWEEMNVDFLEQWKNTVLQEGVEKALSVAKESGEFDGKDGDSVTVSNVSESTEDGGDNVVTFSNGKTLTVKNGNKGGKGDKGEPGEVDYSRISEHNTNETAHNDIRLLIEGLSTRINTIANSDDINLDQLAEIVAYIKNNKSLIDGITTNKINYTDIINNLTTNVTDKPLSAAQGVALKALIDGITVPTKPSDIGAQPAGNYLTTETDPTVPSWAKQTNKPSYSAGEVGAYTKSEADALLNKKANDYSFELYNGTGGNPKPVRFMSVNYSTCNSENGVAMKVGMVSGHGNGSSYAFLQDAIIKVNHQGGVSVDNFKYYGADTGTYDGTARQYGDIFWLHDTTNKIIDFYCLMGQYARMYQTPWRRLTYSTGGGVTQHTSCTVYSSGEKVWGNNSKIALLSDLPKTDGDTDAESQRLVINLTATSVSYRDYTIDATKDEILSALQNGVDMVLVDENNKIYRLYKTIVDRGDTVVLFSCIEYEVNDMYNITLKENDDTIGIMYDTYWYANKDDVGALYIDVYQVDINEYEAGDYAVSILSLIEEGYNPIVRITGMEGNTYLNLNLSSYGTRYTDEDVEYYAYFSSSYCNEAGDMITTSANFTSLESEDVHTCKVIQKGLPISFTINDIEYQAKEGMRWDEWVNSDYNTAGYFIDADSYTAPHYIADPNEFGYYVALGYGLGSVPPIRSHEIIIESEAYRTTYL